MSAGGWSVKTGTVRGAMSDNDLPVCSGRFQSVVQPRHHQREVVHVVVVCLCVDDDEVDRVIADVLDVVVPQPRLVPALLVFRQLHLHVLIMLTLCVMFLVYIHTKTKCQLVNNRH